MARLYIILVITFGFIRVSFGQHELSQYRSIGGFGNIPLHLGNNHFAKDIGVGYGFGINFRLPIYNFGITGQWQTSKHTISNNTLFHVNTPQMRNNIYTLFIGYNMCTAHGTFEPRLNISRLKSRYLSDYKNRQTLSGLGLKYGLAFGSKGLYLSTSLDYFTNITNRIVAPENFSKYMNQSQTLLFNLGLEWRMSK
jgi:hypothetical protein